MDNTETSIDLREWNRGNSRALERLLEQHLSWIRARVSQRLGPRLRRKAETGDIVQEAVVQFLRYGPRIQISDEGHFRALMCRIVENVLRDKNDWFAARRRAASRECPLPSDTVLDLDPRQGKPDSPSQMAMQHEQEAWVRLGLEILDADERRVIVLRDWDGYTFADIGSRLGISLDAARRKYIRSFDRLTEKVWALRSGNLNAAL